MQIFVQLFRVSIKFDFFEVARVNEKMFYPFLAAVRDGIAPDLVGETDQKGMHLLLVKQLLSLAAGDET